MRLTERFLHPIRRPLLEVAAARELVREKLGEAFRAVPVESAATWVGLAGTFTTVAALAKRMTTYDADAIHLSTVTFGDLLPVRRARRHDACWSRRAGSHARGGEST